jgi:hypothetical protein
LNYLEIVYLAERIVSSDRRLIAGELFYAHGLDRADSMAAVMAGAGAALRMKLNTAKIAVEALHKTTNIVENIP